jgi:hypothetical protein
MGPPCPNTEAWDWPAGEMEGWEEMGLVFPARAELSMAPLGGSEQALGCQPAEL